MEKKIKKYIVNGIDSEVDKISLVDFPAIESDFIYMKKEEVKLSFNEPKRMLYGAVLIPSFPIYRVSPYGEEYYIEFTAEAIEQLERRFMMENRNWEFTLDHERDTDRVVLVESWIKLSDTDKSNALGLDVPVGSWIIGAHVDSNEIWEKVKAGNFAGFSVEAMLNLDEIINNNFNNMDKEEKMNKFMDAFKAFLSEFLEKDEPEVEPKEEEVAEEETSEPENKEEENVEVEIPEPAEDNEVVVEEAPESIEPEPEPEQENLSSVIAELEAKLKELEGENNSLQQKVEQLSKQPSAEPVNVNANKQNMRDYLREIANKF